MKISENIYTYENAYKNACKNVDTTNIVIEYGLLNIIIYISE